MVRVNRIATVLLASITGATFTVPTFADRVVEKVVVTARKKEMKRCRTFQSPSHPLVANSSIICKSAKRCVSAFLSLSAPREACGSKVHGKMNLRTCRNAECSSGGRPTLISHRKFRSVSLTDGSIRCTRCEVPATGPLPNVPAKLPRSWINFGSIHEVSAVHL